MGLRSPIPFLVAQVLARRTETRGYRCYLNRRQNLAPQTEKSALWVVLEEGEHMAADAERGGTRLLSKTLLGQRWETYGCAGATSTQNSAQQLLSCPAGYSSGYQRLS